MDPIDRRFVLGAAGLAGVAALSRLAHAGPLDPPVGPIAPTGRTLDDIYGRIARTGVGVAEARIPIESLPGSASALHVITEPGSYVLTRDLIGQPGKDGIEVQVSNAVVDLNGFRLLSGGFGRGVRGFAAAVVNGSIVGWPDGGVSLGYGACAIGLRTSFNGAPGVPALRCDGGVIADCVSTQDVDGYAAFSSVIRSCALSRCDGDAFKLYSGARLVDSVITDVTGAGVFIDGAGTVEDCSFDNCLDGIVVRGHVTVSRCTVINCKSDGIRIVAPTSGAVGPRVDACTLASNGLTAEFNAGAYITRCVVADAAYLVSAGNTVGPIVNVAGVGDISGVPGASHPWANFRR